MVAAIFFPPRDRAPAPVPGEEAEDEEEGSTEEAGRKPGPGLCGSPRPGLPATTMLNRKVFSVHITAPSKSSCSDSLFFATKPAILYSTCPA